MKRLGTVADFGAIDADNDDLVLPSFEDHEAFVAARDRCRFLVVGRKGSGKTAIFKRLLSLTDANLFKFGHTFSDYPWDHHALQARVGIPDFDKYTHSWKYLILLSRLEEGVREKAHRRSVRVGGFGKASRFVNSSEPPEDSFPDTLCTP